MSEPTLGAAPLALASMSACGVRWPVAAGASISPGNVLFTSALMLLAFALVGLLLQNLLLSLLPGMRKKLAAFEAFASEHGGTSGRSRFDAEPWLEVVREHWTLRAEMHIRRRRTFLQVTLRGVETRLDRRVTQLPADVPKTPVEQRVHEAAFQLGVLAAGERHAKRAARDILHETWADRGEVGTQLRGWRKTDAFARELLEAETILAELARELSTLDARTSP